MEKLRRLGDAEREALVALQRRGGSWKAGDRPLWGGSQHWTLQLMASLSRKEYVLVTGADAFELSAAGRLDADRRNPSP